MMVEWYLFCLTVISLWGVVFITGSLRDIRDELREINKTMRLK